MIIRLISYANGHIKTVANRGTVTLETKINPYTLTIDPPERIEKIHVTTFSESGARNNLTIKARLKGNYILGVEPADGVYSP